MRARIAVPYHNDYINPFAMGNQQGPLGTPANDQSNNPSSRDSFMLYCQAPSFEAQNGHPQEAYPGASTGYTENATGYINNQSTASSETYIKDEAETDDADSYHLDDDDEYVPNLPGDDDDYVLKNGRTNNKRGDENQREVALKKRKLNKDGQERKLRQPRGQLRRWDETDCARALIGIVWACGENGINIPFAQAANLVDDRCTASALQQAILKMCAKLNKDGAQLPKIKMNWPKKGEAPAEGKTTVRDNGKLPRKKPTMTQGTQCCITTLGPLRGAEGQDILMNAGLTDEGSSSEPANAQVMTPKVSPVSAEADAATTMAESTNSMPQAKTSSGHESGPTSTEVNSLFDKDFNFGSAEARGAKVAKQGQAANITPPMQITSSPVCPPAPLRIRDRENDFYGAAGSSAMPIGFGNGPASSSFGFGQQGLPNSTQQGQQNRLAYSHMPSIDIPNTPMNFGYDIGGYGQPNNPVKQDSGSVAGVQPLLQFSASSNDSGFGSGSRSDKLLKNGGFNASKTSFKSGRRDSLLQSQSFSQGSQGVRKSGSKILHDPAADKLMRDANDRFLVGMTASALKDSKDPMPSRRASVAEPRPKPRSQLGRNQPRQLPIHGLDKMPDPFVGNFGNISDDASMCGNFSISGNGENPFGPPGAYNTK